MRIAWVAFLAAALADASGPRRSIDLMPLIDVKKDAVGGAWQMEGGTLVSPGLPFSRVLIPYIPPAEYDMRLVVEKRGGTNSLNFGLAAGQVQFMVILDGLDRSGLDLVDGRSFNANDTSVRGLQVEEGRVAEILCAVRRDRVTVAVDGRKVIDWKADYTRLSLHPAWRVSETNTLLVGSWTSRVTYRKIELRPVSGSGRKLR